MDDLYERTVVNVFSSGYWKWSNAKWDGAFVHPVRASVEAVEGECDGMGYQADVSVSPYSAAIFSLS